MFLYLVRAQFKTNYIDVMHYVRLANVRWC